MKWIQVKRNNNSEKAVPVIQHSADRPVRAHTWNNAFDEASADSVDHSLRARPVRSIPKLAGKATKKKHEDARLDSSGLVLKRFAANLSATSDLVTEHILISSEQYFRLVREAYGQLQAVHYRASLNFSLAEWLHIHALLLYGRVQAIRQEIAPGGTKNEQLNLIDLSGDIEVFSPIATILQAIGLVKDEEGGVLYVPDAVFPTQRPFSSDPLLELSSIEIKQILDGTLYDWQRSWSRVLEARSRRDNQLLGVQMTRSSSELVDAIRETTKSISQMRKMQQLDYAYTTASGDIEKCEARLTSLIEEARNAKDYTIHEPSDDVYRYMHNVCSLASIRVPPAPRSPPPPPPACRSYSPPTPPSQQSVPKLRSLEGFPCISDDTDIPVQSPALSLELGMDSSFAKSVISIAQDNSEQETPRSIGLNAAKEYSHERIQENGFHSSHCHPSASRLTNEQSANISVCKPSTIMLPLPITELNTEHKQIASEMSSYEDLSFDKHNSKETLEEATAEELVHAEDLSSGNISESSKSSATDSPNKISLAHASRASVPVSENGPKWSEAAPHMTPPPQSVLRKSSQLRNPPQVLAKEYSGTSQKPHVQIGSVHDQGGFVQYDSQLWKGYAQFLRELSEKHLADFEPMPKKLSGRHAWILNVRRDENGHAKVWMPRKSISVEDQVMAVLMQASHPRASLMQNWHTSAVARIDVKQLLSEFVRASVNDHINSP